ncbi:MAG: metal-sensing transcriptional repressor [Clostridium sp.]|nr:metal-sensing transcriptional repressor [Clostridium sp.]
MNKDQLRAIQALKTSRGQIDGIIKMVQNNRYCK